MSTTSIFDTKNQLGRDRATGWMKFVHEGDKCGGKIVDIFFKDASGIFKEQRCFTIEDEQSNTTLNIGISLNTYNNPRTDMLQVGDSVAFIYDKTIPNKTPGLPSSKSKSILTRIDETIAREDSKSARVLGSRPGTGQAIHVDTSKYVAPSADVNIEI